jgi:hypothetical protein
MKKYIGILFLFLSSLSLYAQGEMFGSTSSNYSGVNSVVLNPSAMHNQKTWLSVNFIAGDLFLHTDYIYLDKDEFWLTNLLKPNIQFIEHPTGYGNEQRAFYSFDSDENTSLDQSLRILGPSIMLSFNQHAFAITSGLRVETNIRNLSPDLANILAYGFSYLPQHEKEFIVDDFNGTTMAWGEIGLSYAYRMNKESFEGWSFGFGLKRLVGVGGGYLNVSQSTYTLLDAKTIDVTNQQAELGFSLPVDFDTNDYIPNSLTTGKGWAMDFGFTYQSLLKRQPKLDAQQFCEQPIINYKYRIGVALLDIGSIRFDKNAQTHDFVNSIQVQGDMTDVELENVNQVIGLISDQFYGSTSSSFVENTMRIALPMAFSIQADYNTQIANLYWNASLIYGIPLQGAALRRPSQLVVAPRYETRFLEFGMPISLYKFQYPHVGVYARVGAFSVGSDWFSSLLGYQNFRGMDFYFSINFQLSKDNCRTKKSYRDACGEKSGRFQWSYN